MWQAIGPGFISLLAFGLQASLTARAQEPPLCEFARRVLSERPSEFARFKGDPSPDDKYGMAFEGTVAPDADTQCTLHVRRKIGGEVLEPLYACTRFELSPEEAKALYAQYKSELGACFSGATVSESSPKEGDATLTWTWNAQAAEYSAKLEATNAIYVLQSMIAGQPLTDLQMSVSLDIMDLSPPRPGASIPEEP
jgi:hypothetical protein